jgi:YD repeat-containing protein
LRKVATTFNGPNGPQWDIPTVTQGYYDGGLGDATGIVNVLPATITTTNIAAGTSTIVNRSYSTLFTAVGITCGYNYTENGNYYCNPLTAAIPQQSGALLPSYRYSVPIGFVSPAEEDTSSASGWLKTTMTSYEFNSPTNAAYISNNVLSLPVSVASTDASGSTIYSKTTYGYDTTRIGYNTSVNQWSNASGSSKLTTSTSYDSFNMPSLLTDSDGNQTNITTTECSGVTPQTPTVQTVTNALSQTTTYVYDCDTGSEMGVSDPNGAQTNYTFDALGRLTEAKYGLGTTPQSPLTEPNLLSTAKLNYPVLTWATMARDQTALNDGLIKSTTVYDGLGRVSEQANPAGYTVTTSYTPSGQTSSVTNPAGDPSTNGTTYDYYDPFGRVIEEVKPDGNQSWWCYDGHQDAIYAQLNCAPSPSNTNAGAVSWVDVTDESGNHHQEVSNALGQLIAVIEPNPQSGALALETDYTYDGNGNLSSVTQLGSSASGETPRVRSFTYDMLSRLTGSTNPESGTTTYQYLNSGALCAGDPSLPCSKTDARGITTTYSYDALNRLLSKSSSNDPSGAPSSCYQYDTASAFGIGRLGSQWTQKGACSSSPGASALTSTAISIYDFMGRIKSQQQCVFSYCSPNSQPTYTYDLAGDLTSYGDGRVGGMQFNSQYDYAARLQTLTDQNAFTLFSEQSYGATGGVASGLYGGTTSASAAFTQTRTYDPQLRITSETDGK